MIRSKTSFPILIFPLRRLGSLLAGVCRRRRKQRVSLAALPYKRVLYRCFQVSIDGSTEKNYQNLKFSLTSRTSVWFANCRYRRDAAVEHGVGSSGSGGPCEIVKPLSWRPLRDRCGGSGGMMDSVPHARRVFNPRPTWDRRSSTSIVFSCSVRSL